jgi:hippurate hydrolase
VDPAIIVAQIIQSFQSIVSRNADPVESLVISTTHIEMGDTNNVIPTTAFMEGTIRTLKPEVRDLAEARMTQVCEHIGLANDAKVDFTYTRLYPVTVNHPEETAFAANVARDIVGQDNVTADTPPVMGGEDFSFMLEARPGAFVFIGQGDTAGLHNREYDFNDEIIPIGCSYWAKLVETAMPSAT